MLEELIVQTRAVGSTNGSIFLSPYFSLIKEKISRVISNKNDQKYYIVDDLSFQIVSYAYEQYFKYVYPYEFKLAQKNGLLKGSTEKKQNSYFIEQLSAQKEWIEYFFEKYPKLLEMLETYSNGIIIHIKYLINAFENDYELLNSHFCLDSSKIDTINLFEGDLHGERCVSSISFENGVKLYYKPRKASNEKFLLDFISCFNKHGLNIRIGIPFFLDGENYSWHLHVNSEEEIACNDAVAEYYYNLGKLQAFFYLLGTQDIIPDNIICVADCPYIVDCETVISKTFKHLDSSKLSLYLRESVLQTGILPDWMFNEVNERSQISSVLFEFGENNKHLPRLNGNACPISEETLQDFKKGFIEACDFFRSNKMKIQVFLELYDFSSLSTRVLLHPTVIYTFLLEEMVTPPYLHGTKFIKGLVSPIVKENSYGSLRDTLVQSITKQIESGNIPYYYTKPDDSSLYTLPGKVIVKEWTSSDQDGFFPIIKRLSRLTEKEQLEQLFIIDETVNFFIDVFGKKSKEARICPSENKTFMDTDVLRAVTRIDKEIRKRMIEIDDEIGFICRTRNPYDGKFQVCLMNDTIYDGIAGVCLFFRTWYTYSHEIQHLMIASKLFKHLCANFDKSYKDVDKNSIPISPLAGITGVLYLMERFPEYYNKSIYTSIVEKVKELIPITIQYDFLSGLAGLISLIVQCKFIEEEERSLILKMSGKRMIQLANMEEKGIYWTYIDGNKVVGETKMALGGYAHGSSSIAVVLRQLYLFFKNEQYLDLFHQTLSHDRSFYSEEIKGWVDGREPLSKQDSGSWCHGATGIALSRLVLKSIRYDDLAVEKELLVALNQIERRIGYNLSVCHGAMGNLEILQSILNLVDEGNTNCIQWINAIVDKINRGKDLVCGDDNRNSQVGLFMGFAGIGYQLLRFYDWESVPSILCLEVAPTTIYLHQKSGSRKAYRVGNK